MENFTPDPFKNYVMKGAKELPAPPPPTITPAQIEKIEAMTRDELITLVKRLACQCGLVASMTREETAQAMLDELATYALRPMLGTALKADINARILAIDKWLDRTEGKAVQKQMIAAKIETRAVNDPDRLMDAARRIEFLLARPPE